MNTSKNHSKDIGGIFNTLLFADWDWVTSQNVFKRQIYIRTDLQIIP